MALWNDKDSPTTGATPAARSNTVADLAPRNADKPAETASDAARRAPRPEAKESLIAAELTIEGKIQGAGNVRLAGRFKGDVHVDGNVSIDPGAHIEGGVQVTWNTVVEREGGDKPVLVAEWLGRHYYK